MIGQDVLDIRQWASNVSLSPEGLWEGPISPLSYPEEGNDFYALIEEGSFWFQHRNHCLLKLIQDFPPGEFLLDVGGGNGFVALALCQNSIPAVLMEPGKAGAQNAKRRGLPWVLHCGFEQAGFQDNSLPSAGLFDVLEHIEKAQDFLAMIKSKLRKGGRLYLTVPAYPWLWSQEDAWAGHYRRYTAGELRRLLEGEGFQVEYLSHFFSFLVVPLFLARALPYRLGLRAKKSPEGEASEHRASGPVLAMLQSLMEWENRRMGEKNIPFGTSCIAVARL